MTVSEKIPAVFIHKGFPNYLKITVACAKDHGNIVIVLGDEENKKIQADEWYPMTNYQSHLFETFQKSYIHRSENPVWFELICFQRYFALLEFMRQKKLTECFMIDSDVLLFDHVNNLSCVNFDAGGGMEKISVNPCVLYWKIPALNDFVLFCLDQYRDPEKWQALDKTYHDMKKEELYSRINICDMLLLKLWADTSVYKWKNFFTDHTSPVIDGNINSPQCADTDMARYKMAKERHIKKYIFEDKMPFIIDTDERKVPVFAIHCQGNAKKYIDSLYHFL